MRYVTVGVLLLAILAVGCGSKGSEPGKVVVTSTADLGKVGVGSSPPPVVPPK